MEIRASAGLVSPLSSQPDLHLEPLRVPLTAAAEPGPLGELTALEGQSLALLADAVEIASRVDLGQLARSEPAAVGMHERIKAMFWGEGQQINNRTVELVRALDARVEQLAAELASLRGGTQRPHGLLRPAQPGTPEGQHLRVAPQHSDTVLPHLEAELAAARASAHEARERASTVDETVLGVWSVAHGISVALADKQRRNEKAASAGKGFSPAM